MSFKSRTPTFLVTCTGHALYQLWLKVICGHHKESPQYPFLSLISPFSLHNMSVSFASSLTDKRKLYLHPNVWLEVPLKTWAWWPSLKTEELLLLCVVFLLLNSVLGTLRCNSVFSTGHQAKFHVSLKGSQTEKNRWDRSFLGWLKQKLLFYPPVLQLQC